MQIAYPKQQTWFLASVQKLPANIRLIKGAILYMRNK